MFLSSRVVALRVQNEKFIENKSSDAPDDRLQASIRSQVNFAENIPLALAVASIVELNGGNRKALTAGLSVLLAARILHAECGIMLKNNLGFGRLPGFLTTQAFIMGMSGYAAYLVKGYWGF